MEIDTGKVCEVLSEQVGKLGWPERSISWL